jgi:hypothetical protein
MRKRTLFLTSDSAPGLPAAPTPISDLRSPDIAGDIKKIESIIAAWKTAKGTGQLHIAIGALGTAVDYANHHLGLKPAPAK